MTQPARALLKSSQRRARCTPAADGPGAVEVVSVDVHAGPCSRIVDPVRHECGERHDPGRPGARRSPVGCRPSDGRCSDKESRSTVPPRVAHAALQPDETGVNGSSFHAQTRQSRQYERGLRPVQIPSRARQRLALGPGPGASSIAGQRTSPVGHPRCSVVAVAAACSSSSTSVARLSHLSHVVCVGRSTRRSEV
jgi:hypothetical protein